MRLAVLSDIHGNVLGLQAVLADLLEIGGADAYWVLGDLVALGPRPVECLDLIRDIRPAQIISGNTETYVLTGNIYLGTPDNEAEWRGWPDRLQHRLLDYSWSASKLRSVDYEYLRDLPAETTLTVPDYGKVIGFHGAPGDDERNLLPAMSDAELLSHFSGYEGRLGFGGHTHLPMDRALGSWRYVNIGSVGVPRDEVRACYVLATFEGGNVNIEFRRVAFNVEAVLTDFQQLNYPDLDYVTRFYRREW